MQREEKQQVFVHKTMFCFFLVLCVFIFNGCALLQLPFTIIDGTFNLLGQLLGIVEKLPKPPPGVFF